LTIIFRKMIKRVFLLFAFVFIATQLLTAVSESASDGNDYMGWPFRYYEYFGGKRIDKYSGKGFEWSCFGIDIALIFLFCCLAVWVMTKFKSSKS
jgi:peptidoglycan/LPS O-acetylase OafA/YrhL